MNRRELLQVSGGALLASTTRGAGSDVPRLRDASWHVEAADGMAADRLSVERRWSGDLCRSRLTNRGKSAVRVKEVVLFRFDHRIPGTAPLYGESFQMLSQTSGTLERPADLGYSEIKHYRIPQPDGVVALSGMMTVQLSRDEHWMLAFTSCRRFAGRFFLRPGSIDVVVDTEGAEVAPGESLDLEEFTSVSGPDRPALLDRLGRRLNENHPPLRFPTPPTGWCSWYCFGPRVTAANVTSNLDAIAKRLPGLKYVQIDDGYQPAMGDWLDTGAAFGGDIQGVLRQIRERGFKPAIWVAPFIAESKSKLFQQHPEWFIQAPGGGPLPSNPVTFGGWRRGPWYALDGTHPGVQKHLEALFRTMRNDWGCEYFKLDANFWGAMHGGRFHDPKATRIEAYRRGMQAVLRGAGDGFILGCNHPIWASLGVIHGSRSSGDVSRRWTTLASIGRQNLNRNWQNGRLWWNDPDAIVLTGNLPMNEFLFHATWVDASGGMILSGDDLSAMPEDRLTILKKLLPPTGVAARFDDQTLSTGRIELSGRTMLCLFNWGDAPKTVSIALPRRSRLIDFWSGAPLGTHSGHWEERDLAGRTARLIEAVPA